jgi:hypothetical protein
MTKEGYKKYEENVAVFSKEENLENLSIINSELDPYFSWRGCECCKSSLGGDRYDCHGYNREEETIQGPYSICIDCIYYNEYGQLDDQTMLDMDND